ncbi:hypothetical protein LguiA_034525 [Lonicera macranthoides]
MGSEEGVIEGEGFSDVENTIFVAVGKKNFKESKSILLWVLKSFAGRKICILHVHQPSHLATLMDGKLSASKLKQQAVKACRELELQKMHKLLNQYLLVIAQVQAGKVWIENENIEKGIVQIIVQHRIRWLVMGAAAEKHYSRKMSELMSKKAIYVCEHAPVSCNIWFACKGCLIYTRERSVNVCSQVERILALSSPTITEETKLLLDHAANAEEENANTSPILEHSTRSKNKAVGTSKSTPLLMDELSSDNVPLSLLQKSQDRLFRSSSAILLEERSQGQTTPNLYHKLEQAMIDAENAKKKTFEESMTRWRAEEDAVEALHKAEAAESLFMEEVNKRKEMEELLERQRQECKNMKNWHDQCIKELQMVRNQIPKLESRITVSHCTEKELEEKIIQAVELLISFKEKRDKMLTDCEKANRDVLELRKLVEKDTRSLCGLQFKVFSFLEIIEGTQNFDPMLKIGEGKCGSVYKGILCQMKVAIKMLPCHGSEGISDFEHEATLLSRVRHPNLITLIGTCPESTSLVYEYLENGSLEDRLACRGKNPLPWQTRIKIAVEVCSSLIFLHSNNPCIVHGNLKSTNVLLDPNFVSKLSDFGIYRLIPRDEKNDPTVSVYVDPEFLETGELTVESDIYSFGIVLMRTLTGRPALGVVNDVKCAVENGNFDAILDISAGDWPLEQAKKLANLALRCCENKPTNRPALVPDVWSLIEPMRGLCNSSGMETEGRRKVPSHFVCPIFQEVMKDPYIAADGFTYEEDAIKGWLNSGHKTSPMTNLMLDHCDLIPNYALYYAIQEWLQQS